MTDAGVVVWYNPRCSKCRGAEQLLAAYGVPAQRVQYLDDPPAREEIVRVLALLGAEGLGPGGAWPDPVRPATREGHLLHPRREA